MKKLIVFDYEKCKLHIYSVNIPKSKEPVDGYLYALIEKFGHNWETADVMVVDGDNDIIVH
jgi:hypothetical protein